MSASFPISDLRLKTLAEEPAGDLFPSLASSTAFWPWTVLLAFLAPLPGIFTWTLDERSAAWALHALDQVQTLELEHPVLSSAEDASRLQSAPPLSLWLTGLTLRYWPAQLPWGLMLISYIATAATILAAARLSRRFGVERLGVLTAICCAGSPLIINSAHLAGPEMLGLCLMTVALERFFAHLDTSVGAWSGRLITAGLAWGGAWLSIGWPALTLGAALTIHGALFGNRFAERVPAVEMNKAGWTPMQKYRRSLIVFWIIGLISGAWSLADDIHQFGWVATMAWMFDPTPHAASPFYPKIQLMAQWGAAVGVMFLWGWISIGMVAIVQQQASVLTRTDGRGMVLILWWVALLICRVVVDRSSADTTMWDIWRCVPACIIAAIGMELVIERRVPSIWLSAAVIIGLSSLTLLIPLIDSVAVHSAVLLGAAICLAPIIRNLWESRSLQWTETQTRRVMLGLLISTWLAHLAWGIAQTKPTSRIDARLERQLNAVQTDLPQPGAVIVVSQSRPARTLLFQLRQHWPDAPLVTDDRWESAISRTLSSVDNWAESQFLVVELTPRDSQFRRPSAGWIVTPVGEPRRYHGDQLTLHAVAIQSP